jgi:hypothetical protein
VVVFLLLGVIWAAVLVPPWLQSRREARPIASIMSFRSQLWSLQRATPNYGADVYTTYGEDYYYDDDAVDGYAAAFDDVDGDADVRVLGPVGRPADPAVGTPGHAPVASPGYAPAESASALTTGAPAAAIVRRRALAYRRRRQVLGTLVVATLAGAGPAALLGGAWVVVEVVASTLLLTYLALLIRRGRRSVERVEKVRYLTPIRAPRPAVVILGSGAAR